MVFIDTEFPNPIDLEIITFLMEETVARTQAIGASASNSKQTQENAPVLGVYKITVEKVGITS